jgi:uncharacterized paraquat-inducible protein A
MLFPFGLKREWGGRVALARGSGEVLAYTAFQIGAKHMVMRKNMCPNCSDHRFSWWQYFKLCTMSGTCPRCNAAVRVNSPGWFTILISMAVPFVLLFMLFSDYSPLVALIRLGMPFVFSFFISTILFALLISVLLGFVSKVSLKC